MNLMMQKKKIMKEKIYKVIMSVGKITGCHQLPERSFRIGKYQFPVCSRCTGIGVGYMLGFILLFVGYVRIDVCVLFMSIMFLDWFFQYENIIISTNPRRFITGVVCGVGYLHICARIIGYTVKLVKLI